LKRINQQVGLNTIYSMKVVVSGGVAAQSTMNNYETYLFYRP